MEALQLDKLSYTPEEFFALLEVSEFKLEYYDGTITMMSGGSISHGRIKADVGIHIGKQLRQCRPFDSDTAIAIPKVNRYLFPDLSYVCAPKDQFEDRALACLLNPTLIVEVLSKSTAAHDRGEKFRAYRQIPTFREYLLIESERMLVDHYLRGEDNRWEIRSYTETEEIIDLVSLEVKLPLSVVYGRVELGEKSEADH